jgi:hypothetical protein
MPVAIDTSVLIHAEKAGDFEHLLPDRRHAVGGKRQAPCAVRRALGGRR